MSSEKCHDELPLAYRHPASGRKLYQCMICGESRREGPWPEAPKAAPTPKEGLKAFGELDDPAVVEEEVP